MVHQRHETLPNPEEKGISAGGKAEGEQTGEGVQEAKNNYRKKVEEKFTSGNMREVWQGLNIMMGHATKPFSTGCTDPASFAEELNIIFNRFNQNKTSENFSFSCHINDQAISVDGQLVTSIL